MPFTSGNVKSINQFMDVMSTYAVANASWVILAGGENNGDSGQFPLNSRYYRFVFKDPSLGGMNLVEFDLRATAGGADLGITEANVTFSSGSGVNNPLPNLFDGNFSTYWDSQGGDIAILDIDFGADQTIRELTLSVWDVPSAPQTIEVYRSEDPLGIYWDRVHTFSGLSWSAFETKALTLPADLQYHATATATGGVRRPCRYILQGPGYDASRRVYLGFEVIQDLTDGNQGFKMQGFTGYNAALDMDTQLQSIPYANTPVFIIDNSVEDIDYWLYVNSTRIIGVLRSGAGDYASFHAGFLASFANPDQHPNPLYIAGTSPQLGNTTTLDWRLWDEAHTSNSSFWDPGRKGGLMLDYKGDWQFVENNVDDNGLGRNPIGGYSGGTCWISPWQIGGGDLSSVSGTYDYMGRGGVINDSHYLSNQVVTLQDELPVWDCMVKNVQYGVVGAIQGVVGVPGAGSLVPEQTLTIGGVTYRVFPKRTVRQDAQWVAIAEQ